MPTLTDRQTRAVETIDSMLTLAADSRDKREVIDRLLDMRAVLMRTLTKGDE